MTTWQHNSTSYDHCLPDSLTLGLTFLQVFYAILDQPQATAPSLILLPAANPKNLGYKNNQHHTLPIKRRH